MRSTLKIVAILMITMTYLFSGSALAASSPNRAVAIFAGGCFWCMEHAFDKQSGVLHTISGYTGGHVANPTYRQVSRAKTGHYEVVKVIYNPKRVSYAQLLKVFWRNIDPTDSKGQFCDKGPQYRAAIFYVNAQQKVQAIISKKQLRSTGRFKRIYTQILPATKFYPAEQYHQNYYKKNPIRYNYYRRACGRDRTLHRLHGRK